MTLFCNYGCQTAIKFDKGRISANGKKIPLNLDGTYHDCPKSPFNLAKRDVNNDDSKKENES